MKAENEKSFAGNEALINNSYYNYNKNSNEDKVLNEALCLYTLGFSVIPIHGITDNRQCTCGNPQCDQKGKHSIRAWKKYQSERMTEDEIKAAFSSHPNANLGIITGEISNIFVLDIDNKNDKDGEKSLRQLEEKYSPLPATMEVISGSGGRHLYFKYPESKKVKNSTSEIGVNIDIRGEGGYIVAPPSLHESGRHYEWSVDSVDEIADAPEWLLNLVTEKVNSSKASHSSALKSGSWRDQIYGVSEGKRNDTMASMAGKLLSSGLTYEETMTMCHSLNQNSPDPLQDEEVTKTINSIHKIHIKSLQEDDSDCLITCFDDVDMKRINWLWPDRIAGGKISILAGNPGLGKSQITAFFASIITNGGEWPCGNHYEDTGHVLFLSAEDDPADTIKPRLLAAGANTKQCHIMQAIAERDSNGKKRDRHFNLKKDIARLETAIKKIGNVKMVIIDPISAYLGETDSHKDADIRATLAPLSDMAMKHEAAIILVTHFNKSKDQDMVARVIGSIGTIAAARAGFAVMKDEEDKNKRLFIPLKNNIGNDYEGFSYTIEGKEVAKDIHSSKIVWNDEIIDIHKMFNPEKKTQTNGAKAFLLELLSNGKMAASDILEEADGMGYSKSTIQRAATALGVQRKKDGMKGGWFWSLPLHEDCEDAEDIKNSENSTLLFLEDLTSKKVKSSQPSTPSDDMGGHDNE